LTQNKFGTKSRRKINLQRQSNLYFIQSGNAIQTGNTIHLEKRIEKMTQLLSILGKTLLIFLAVVLTENVANAEKPKLRIATIEWWPPFSGPKFLNQGFLTEMNVAILKRAGYDSEVFFYPWVRAFQMAKRGTDQVLLGGGFREERTEWFIYSKAYIADETVIVMRKGRGTKFTSLEVLAPATFGAHTGSLWAARLEKILGFKVETVILGEQSIKKVAWGRIDYCILERFAVNLLLNTSLRDLKDKVEIMHPPVEPGLLYTMFSKKMPDYEKVNEDFNEALAAMHADGSFDAILKNHSVNYTLDEGVYILDFFQN